MKTKFITEVIIQIEAEGFHNYTNAPKEVSFLESRHRHNFIIKCGYKVTHDNREQEIFLCREDVKNYLAIRFGIPCEFDSMSCEMIASAILTIFETEMNWVEVWEEKTGGARVEKVLT